MQFARSSSSSNSILKRPFDSAGNNESGRTQYRYDDVNEESSSDDDAYESDQYTLKRNDYSRDRQADDDTSMELREATVAVNVGMLLLQKMGWRDGLGLGATNQGRLEPVPSATNYGVSGIGKVSQDSRMLDSTTLLPRELESQAIARETPDQRLAREQRASHKQAIMSEIKTTLQSFFCEICKKGYSNVSQFDEHTNSYDHHHQARARATQLAALERKKSTGETDKRREKERKREEKELSKLMGAAGVKASTKPNAMGSTTAVTKSDASTLKKGGWNAVGSSGSVSIGSASAVSSCDRVPAPKKGGWASVGTASTSTSTASSALPQPTSPAASLSALPSLSSPAFRSGGYLSKDLLTPSIAQPSGSLTEAVSHSVAIGSPSTFSSLSAAHSNMPIHSNVSQQQHGRNDTGDRRSSWQPDLATRNLTERHHSSISQNHTSHAVHHFPPSCLSSHPSASSPSSSSSTFVSPASAPLTFPQPSVPRFHQQPPPPPPPASDYPHRHPPPPPPPPLHALDDQQYSRSSSGYRLDSPGPAQPSFSHSSNVSSSQHGQHVRYDARYDDQAPGGIRYRDDGDGRGGRESRSGRDGRDGMGTEYDRSQQRHQSSRY